jgi:hypothetical protein
MFKQRDVVNEDFYFFEKKDGKLVLDAVDCTVLLNTINTSPSLFSSQKLSKSISTKSNSTLRKVLHLWPFEG